MLKNVSNQEFDTLTGNRITTAKACFAGTLQVNATGTDSLSTGPVKL